MNRYLDEAQVRAVLSWECLIPAMEAALASFSLGLVTQPVRTILTVPPHQERFGIMPVVYGDVMGAKLVSVFHGNAEIGLATHQAVIQLFETRTGAPVATMDGRLVTEMRTAAVSAIATRLLSHPDSRVLAVLGSGVQARSHIQALRLVRSFEEIRIWSRTAANAERLAKEVDGKAMAAEEAVRGADVVVTVTAAREPILQGCWVKSGAHVNAVGAVGAAIRELDDEAMANPVIVESREAALTESGDILLSHATIDAELGELLAGTKSIDASQTTIYKSLGIGVEDIAAAKLVWDRIEHH
ncbi:MAG TPA: ornithine cyclodeaminase family protein [Bryobacteraceae bacterium]|jgi:thiomorpholine-carboxylate dehydrogenase|nr:ornithine cyclodeaminase family protein [Bryobacteraceae bacterium]